MKIYLAASYSRFKEMQECANQLKTGGHEMVSTWINGEDCAYDDSISDGTIDPKLASEFASRDIREICCADTIILFTGGGRGGRHWECGFGHFLMKRIIIVGEREHLFHYLPTYTVVADFNEALELLKPKPFVRRNCVPEE